MFVVVIVVTHNSVVKVVLFLSCLVSSVCFCSLSLFWLYNSQLLVLPSLIFCVAYFRVGDCSVVVSAAIFATQLQSVEKIRW
jgi:biotin transporter BioY